MILFFTCGNVLADSNVTYINEIYVEAVTPVDGEVVDLSLNVPDGSGYYLTDIEWLVEGMWAPSANEIARVGYNYDISFKVVLRPGYALRSSSNTPIIVNEMFYGYLNADNEASICLRTARPLEEVWLNVYTPLAGYSNATTVTKDMNSGSYDANRYWDIVSTTQYWRGSDPNETIIAGGETYRLTVELSRSGEWGFGTNTAAYVNGNQAQLVRNGDHAYVYYDTYINAPIHNIDLTFDVPEAGEPYLGHEFRSPDGAAYSCHTGFWYQQTSRGSSSSSSFAPGYRYDCTIRVSAAIGYVFAEDVVCTVNGQVVEGRNRNTLFFFNYSVDLTGPEPSSDGTTPQAPARPASTSTYYACNYASVTYSTHVQNIGWQDYVYDGATAGTEGRSLRLEALAVNLESNRDLGIRYCTHIQNIGWQEWRYNGVAAGTEGLSYRLEAVKIELTGNDADLYDICYRVHVQNIGWMDWVRNGEIAGTEGQSLRLEGIEIKIIPKGTPLNMISYDTHVENIGWQAGVNDGIMSGTSGQSLRLEGIHITVNSSMGIGVEYRTHIQNIGWEETWRSNGEMSGTEGQSLRLEAIEIRLTGENAAQYDIYYRTHIQNIGWTGWASNGASCGSAGYAYRLEGIEIVIVPHGNAVPGGGGNAFYQA